MTNPTAAAACEEMRLLIQAEIDGELDAARSAALAAHLADCAGCAGTRERLIALSADLRRSALYHPAPAALGAAVDRLVAASRPAPRDAGPTANGLLRRLRRRRSEAAAFGGGAAVAALLALLLVAPERGDFAGQIVSSHIRALQPGHLMDVVSDDRHTVKPWFDGRLDFAPAVKNLDAQGFPLLGGRLDYVDGHEAGALVYGRAKHVINLFIWPHRGRSAPPQAGQRNGYNFVCWTGAGAEHCAVSDLEADQLADFARLWREAS